jgi:hypothetical protein
VAAGDQINPALAAIPGSGVRVVFQDNQLGGSWDLTSALVSVSGSASALSTVSATTDDELVPAITNVGNGNMVVAWQRKSVDGDIYAAFLGGAAAPLSVAPLGQINPIVVPDGSNGAIVAWTDQGSNGEIYSQRLNSNGQTSWSGTNGVDVSNSGFADSSPTGVADGNGGALIAFAQTSVGIAAERIERFGYLGNPEPQVSRIFDIPSDQGGLVHVVWNASYLDTDPSYVVGSYNLWRQIDAAAAERAIDNGARLLKEGEPPGGRAVIRAMPAGSTALIWEYLGSVPARANATYSFPAPTLADSMPDGPHNTVFMVDAQARTGSAFWESSPDSGHSVDNLAPAAPAGLIGNYGQGATHLHWARNNESDLAGYRIYRGSDAAFVPSTGNLIASVADTGYAQSGPAGEYFKLSAVDVHGNQSSYAVLLPGGTSSVPPGSLFAFQLSEVRPNPARGTAHIAFSLPAPARVRLGVYDVEGRLRRTLFDQESAAGDRNLSWDLRDNTGQLLGAALYFVRIDSPFGTGTRRVVVLE